MKKTIQKLIILLITVTTSLHAQVPVAGFSIVPNPVCSGNVVQINDLSTGSPTAWSYTVAVGGPGGQVLTTQNPTLNAAFPGTYTVTLVATNSSGNSAPVSHTVQVLASPQGNINANGLSTCIGGNPVTMNVLTGPGGASNTYSWSNGATTQSITVSPTVTTNYSVVITSTNGCSLVRSVTVTVAPPSLTITGVPFSICPGSLSTLAVNNPGQAPYSYTWSTGANTRTLATNVPAVYNVTVTNGQNCTGVQSFTLGTSTTLSLTIAADPTIVCAGNTSNLSVRGATSYAWSNGGTTQNMAVTPSVTTTYTVNGNFSTCSGTAAVTVSVSNIPTITVSGTPLSMCAGNTAVLNANGASTYTWLPSGTLTQSTTVTPSVSTTYTVRGVNSPCAARTATISIQVLPLPVISIATSNSLICPFEQVALAASGAASYTWNTGTNNPVMLVTPATTTTYSIVGVGSNGCSNTASFTQSVTECVAIAEQSGSGSSLVVFPNPSAGEVTFKASVNTSVNITDQCGRSVAGLVLSADNSFRSAITLPAGLYFIADINRPSEIRKLVIIN